MSNIASIGCVIIGILIHSIYDMWIDKREWRRTCIEVDLDKCCENAYNMGYYVGLHKRCAESGCRKRGDNDIR